MEADISTQAVGLASSADFSLMNLFIRADIIVKSVIIILIACSVYSWAVIIEKFRLFKKINDLRKYFSSINKDENFEQSLTNLTEAKKVVFDFFDNVIVNEDDQTIKKNRLELIQMLCKTFDNYVNFSLIDSH